MMLEVRALEIDGEQRTVEVRLSFGRLVLHGGDTGPTSRLCSSREAFIGWFIVSIGKYFQLASVTEHSL